MIRKSLNRESSSRFNDLTIHESNIRFCLGQADHFLTVLPLATFLEKFDALKTF